MEVDQQAPLDLRQSQVTQQLSTVNVLNFRHGFHFNYDLIVDDEIGTKSYVDFDSIVLYGYWLLALDTHALLDELTR